MAENKVSIDVELAIADAQSRIDKLDKQFTAFGVNATGAVGKADKAWATFAGTLAGLGVAKAIETASRAMVAFAKAIVVDGIEAAKKYEDALNNLNGALAQTGIYSASTSAELEAFANQLEGASRFSDDAVLSASALIQTLGNLDKDGLKKATQSAADLAAALQIDLASAATLVGKVSAGELGALSRYGIKLDDTGTSAEKAARGLAALQERFGGRALQDLNTFSGATTQMSNAWEDFTKAIGLAITKNPAVLAGVKELTKMFQDFEKYVAANKVAVNGFIRDGVLLAIDAMIIFGEVVDGTIRFASAAWNGLKATVSAVIIAMLAPFAAFSDTAKDMLAQATQGFNEDVNKMAQDLGETGVIGKLTEQARAARERVAAADTAAADTAVNNQGRQVEAIKQTGTWETWLADLKTKNSKNSVAETKSALGTISTLHNSQIKELFYIGKAAALAQATINGFEAVTKAFAIGGPLGFILGPLVAVAVGAQIAGIAAQQPPAFATGGIVPGTSLSGDNQLIRANSREAVLNLDQQTKLFNAINEGQLGGGGGVTIAIQGDLIVDSPSRVDNLIERINERVRYGNTPLFATGLA